MIEIHSRLLLGTGRELRSVLTMMKYDDFGVMGGCRRLRTFADSLRVYFVSLKKCVGRLLVQLK